MEDELKPGKANARQHLEEHGNRRDESMIYELSSPSGPSTFKADRREVAFLTVLMVGNGWYAASPEHGEAIPTAAWRVRNSSYPRSWAYPWRTSEDRRKSTGRTSSGPSGPS